MSGFEFKRNDINGLYRRTLIKLNDFTWIECLGTDFDVVIIMNLFSDALNFFECY